MDGITGWINGWKRNGWKTSAKQPVKNADLWQRWTQRLPARRRVAVGQGHSGDPGNERADALANARRHGRHEGAMKQRTFAALFSERRTALK